MEQHQFPYVIFRNIAALLCYLPTEPLAPGSPARPGNPLAPCSPVSKLN